MSQSLPNREVDPTTPVSKLLNLIIYSSETELNEETFSLPECIPVGCVPTATVSATRCQYQGCGLPSGGVWPLKGDLPQGRGLLIPTVNRQTPLKTLPSLAVGKYVRGYIFKGDRQQTDSINKM